MQEFINGFDEKEYNTPDKLSGSGNQRKIQLCFRQHVSSVLFQNVSSLALCEDGRMVLENVLEAVQPIIEEAMKVATTSLSSRACAHGGI